jgi:predicted ABC-type exoprotein transport system permease subunit
MVILLIVSLLMLPMGICYLQHTDRARFITIFISVLLFAAVLALVTPSKKAEVFGATAA